MPRILAIVFMLLIPVSAVADPPSFVQETIIDKGVDGAIQWPTMAVDAMGRIHIAWFDWDKNDLMYAVGSYGSWTVETVISSTVGRQPCIAVDGNGVPHISSYNWSLGDLAYSNRAGGTWSTITLDAAGDVGIASCITIDDGNRIHISYRDNTNNLAKYARYDGGWSFSTFGFVGGGYYTSVAADANGNPHISHYNATNSDLNYSYRTGSWSTSTIDATGFVGFGTSIGLDNNGQAHILYYDSTNGTVKYAWEDANGWNTTTLNYGGLDQNPQALGIDADGNVHVAYDRLGHIIHGSNAKGYWELEGAGPKATVGEPAINLDPSGNVRILYEDYIGGKIQLLDNGLYLNSPQGGETWAVGSEQTVTWRGAGTVDVLLSVDGGSSFDVIASGVDGGNDPYNQSYTLRVPHRPTKFAMLKIEREAPFSYSETDSLFTIETSIALLSFTISLSSDGSGNDLTWQTDPGPGDLSGYRVDKLAGEDWRTIVAQTTATTYHDAAGGPGDGYRLYAVNGFGDEFLVGEASAGGPPLAAKLDAWPVPFRSGDLTIAFATVSGFGGGSAEATVAIYDVQGRLVRRIVSGRYPAGVQTVTWDGRDGAGELVTSGVYFIRVSSGDSRQTRKIAVVR